MPPNYRKIHGAERLNEVTAAARVQGWEAVCGGVLGISLLDNNKVLWFLGSWFLGFWFVGFLVSEFLGFLVSKIQKTFNIFERYLVHITKVPFHIV